MITVGAREKNVLMIRLTIYILKLVFTYLIICLICLRNKNYHYDFENSHISA